VRWNIDLVQTLSTPDNVPGHAKVAASFRIKIAGDVAVLFGVNGEGQDAGSAFDRSTFTVSLAYEDKPIVMHKYTPQGT
jgi:hypothetical protein